MKVLTHPLIKGLTVSVEDESVKSWVASGWRDIKSSASSDAVEATDSGSRKVARQGRAQTRKKGK